MNIKIIEQDHQEKIKEENALGINSPFNKECIDGISLRMSRNIFKNNRPEYNAYIYFKNGVTSGEHKLSGESLSDIFLKAEKFVQSL